MMAATWIALAGLLSGEVCGGLRGGGVLARAPGAGNCVPLELRAQVTALLAARARTAGAGKQLAAPPLLPAPALGCNLQQDAVLDDLVDLDPTSGIRDYSCHGFTFDGHGGHDVVLRSLSEQYIGVPVFAVRGGAVASAHDGSPDVHSMGSPITPGNYLVIDHGDGTSGWYFNLRMGSVAFAVGQSVVAGQQVGLAGSSGNTEWPQLHFEVTDVLGNAVEPYSGACNPTASGWAHQEPLDLEPFLYDFGVTYIDIIYAIKPPASLPTNAQIPLDAGFVDYWYLGGNLAPGSTWRWVFVRPDGTVAHDSSTQPFSDTAFLRTYWKYFSWWIPEMQTTPGTWHARFEINGKQLVDAPVEVVATVDQSFNRAPEPIAVAFDPPSPSPGAPLFCRVHASVYLEDLDWDIVRYRYLWQVNGAVVRNVESAGRADALPADAFQDGDQVRCEVTPRDWVSNGPTAVATATAATDRWTNLGQSKYGGAGVPHLDGSGPLSAGSPNALVLSQAQPSRPALLFLGTAAGSIPLLGGTLVPAPVLWSVPLFTSLDGGFELQFAMPAGVPSGRAFVLQAWIEDPAALLGASASNGLAAVTP